MPTLLLGTLPSAETSSSSRENPVFPSLHLTVRFDHHQTRTKKEAFEGAPFAETHLPNERNARTVGLHPSLSLAVCWFIRLGPFFFSESLLCPVLPEVEHSIPIFSSLLRSGSRPAGLIPPSVRFPWPFSSRAFPAVIIQKHPSRDEEETSRKGQDIIYSLPTEHARAHAPLIRKTPSFPGSSCPSLSLSISLPLLLHRHICTRNQFTISIPPPPPTVPNTAINQPGFFICSLYSINVLFGSAAFAGPQ